MKKLLSMIFILTIKINVHGFFLIDYGIIAVSSLYGNFIIGKLFKKKLNEAYKENNKDLINSTLLCAGICQLIVFCLIYISGITYILHHQLKNTSKRALRIRIDSITQMNNIDLERINFYFHPANELDLFHSYNFSSFPFNIIMVPHAITEKKGAPEKSKDPIKIIRMLNDQKNQELINAFTRTESSAILALLKYKKETKNIYIISDDKTYYNN